MDENYILTAVDRWKRVLASKFASASAKVQARKELSNIKKSLRVKGLGFR